MRRLLPALLCLLVGWGCEEEAKPFPDDPPSGEGEGEPVDPPLGEGEGEPPVPGGEGEGEPPAPGGEGEGEPPPVGEGEGEGEGEADVVVDVEGGDPVPGLGGPVGVVQGARGRRLRADALRSAISTVAGADETGQPIAWRVPRGFNGGRDRLRYRRYDVVSGTFETCRRRTPTTAWCDGFHDLVYGGVLGRPDYYAVPLEDRTINLTYAKLLRDAAWNVCDQMVMADLVRGGGEGSALSLLGPIDCGGPDPEERADACVLDDPELLVETLRLLVLKFHGLDRGPGDPVIEALVTLFEAGAQSNVHPELDTLPPAVEGYRAVCVALFEDPLFHLW